MSTVDEGRPTGDPGTDEVRRDESPDPGQWIVVAVLVAVGLFAIVSTWDVVAGFELGLESDVLPLQLGLQLADVHQLAFLLGQREHLQFAVDLLCQRPLTGKVHAIG